MHGIKGLRFALLIGAVFLYYGHRGDSRLLARESWCDDTGVCNSSVDCSTSCTNRDVTPNEEITCGSYNDGYLGGYCSGGCGDGICDVNNGEDEDSCPSDCDPGSGLAKVRFPDDGYHWANRLENWPDDNQVDDCLGNCGKSCKQWNICNSPEQYWQLDILDSPSHDSFYRCSCADDTNLLDCGTFDVYTASGRWTYYGWIADGCYWHDDSCRNHWYNWALTVVGVVTGVAWGDWWILATVGEVTCYDSVTFWTGGGCSNAQADQWSYYLTVTTSDYTHESYEYGSPGECYDGPPKCGDGICQNEDCGPLVVDYPNPTPGDGCEETTDSCSSDCG